MPHSNRIPTVAEPGATSWLPHRRVSIEKERPPSLLIVVDTEEEFDWNGGFHRENNTVSAMSEVGKAQRIFDAYGVAPCYVVDYPVADQPAGIEPLLEIFETRRAVLGAHLHPWVNPPLEEELTHSNSFPGNLPRGLETAKLRRLVERIEESFGEHPVIYKAGRYGLGTSSPASLLELGFAIDLSASPPFDYSAEGGPDYSTFPLEPFWFGPECTLLGIPSTAAYVGRLGSDSRAHRLYARASMPLATRAKIPAVLSRLRLLERLRLSPEGYSLAELERLTRDLVRRGHRVFVLSFHSPSLKPGCTPYVRTRDDVGRFLDTLDRFLEFFFTEIEGRADTPFQLRDELLASRGSTSP
jgi:hypothetical protein